MPTAAELLREEFVGSSDRLDARLQGLSDEEFLWEPCSGCWTLRPISELGIEASGRSQIDYEDHPPDPPPVTTIAWRLVHVASGNWIYWEHAFGPGVRTFLDLEIPGTAGAATRWLRDSQELWIKTLESLEDRNLDLPRPTNWGDEWPTHRLISTLIVEQTHHGAEIGLLRDLFRESARLSAPRTEHSTKARSSASR